MKTGNNTIPAMFERSVLQYGNNTLILEKEGGVYRPQSYREVQDKVLRFAAALRRMGVNKGDRLALLSEGRSEWLVAELAMLHLGAVDVPLSVKLNEPEELKFRISHSECRFVLASDRQLEKIRDIRAELPLVESVIVIGEEQAAENERSFDEMMAQEIGNREIQAVKDIAENLSDNDLANISYTSGTTADPKGIMLSHRNYTANVEQAGTLMEVPPYYSSLLILPWDHSFAHTVGLYTLIHNGASMSVVELGKTPMETLRNIPKNIKEAQPTFLLSVPALAKNFKKNIEKGIKEKGPKVEKLFNRALNTAYTYYGNGFDKGKGFRAFLKPLVWLYDKILFSKIREGFGGKLEFFIGGGALLDLELQRFFYAIGIPMFQGYGLSEASPVISSNAPLKHKLGSSGFLVKPLDLKIVDHEGNELPTGAKGEIVVKGENVMLGYWKNEKATAETIKNGWLHTGDMGYMDADGFLYVLGRFKSLLIGNDGEKYSPEGIEEALVELSPFIEQVMLYNNQDAYTIALLYPDYAALKKAVQDEGLEARSDAAAERMAVLLREEINKFLPGGAYDSLFPARWLPAALGVVDEAFSEENKMINSTMKLVRAKVTEHYKTLIEFLYTPEGKDVTSAINVERIKKSL